MWLSTNGTTWTSQTPQGITGGYANFTSVIYANNMFVTTDNAFFGNSTIYTSTDGITWTDRNANTMKGLEAVVYANGTFVAVGANSIVASTDGMTWAAESSPSANHAYAVTYGAGQFRAVGNTGNGTLAEIVSSPDGVNWLDQTGPINLALGGAVYFGGLFYASGDAELIVAGK